MANRNDIHNEATRVAKNHIQDFIDPVTNEVRLTELGEWLAVEFKFEEGDETPFEIAFNVAEWLKRIRSNPGLAATLGYSYSLAA